MDSIKKLLKYYPVIKKHIRANSGSTAEAEDIFQEGLLIFLEKTGKPGFELSSSAETFLFGICKNLWQNQLRKKGRFVKTDTNLLSGEEKNGNDPEEEKIKLAEQAVAFLEEKCKSILHLFYYQKASLAAIAKRFKMISETAARNQKFQCLEKARQKYKELSNQSA